jgi:hypothetical protein
MSKRKTKEVEIGTLETFVNPEDKEKYDIYIREISNARLSEYIKKIGTINKSDLFSFGYRIHNVKAMDIPNLHPDLRQIANFFPYFSYYGFPSLMEVGITTDGGNFVWADGPLTHLLGYDYEKMIGQILPHKEIIKVLQKYIKNVNKYLKSSPSASGFCRLAYLQSWITFLKKNVPPYTNY